MPTITFLDGPAAGRSIDYDHPRAPDRLTVLVHDGAITIADYQAAGATDYRLSALTYGQAAYAAVPDDEGLVREIRYGGVDEDVVFERPPDPR